MAILVRTDGRHELWPRSAALWAVNSLLLGKVGHFQHALRAMHMGEFLALSGRSGIALQPQQQSRERDERKEGARAHDGAFPHGHTAVWHRHVPVLSDGATASAKPPSAHGSRMPRDNVNNR